jgi:hypothetical protein
MALSVPSQVGQCGSAWSSLDFLHVWEVGGNDGS